jgi:hypothetical protein
VGTGSFSIWYSTGHTNSVVGIATGYGQDGPGIESRWGRDFPHLSRPALGPIQPPVQWVPGLIPRVKSGQGVTLTPHPLLVPWSRKSRAIPLLPLCAVRPVQSLSACTRVHFTFTNLFPEQPNINDQTKYSAVSTTHARFYQCNFISRAFQQ